MRDTGEVQFKDIAPFNLEKHGTNLVEIIGELVFWGIGRMGKMTVAENGTLTRET